MLLASHLRRSRHGIYYFRVILPAQIAAVLGQRELVRSLGIRSPKVTEEIWLSAISATDMDVKRAQRNYTLAFEEKTVDGQEVALSAAGVNQNAYHSAKTAIGRHRPCLINFGSRSA